MPTGFDVDAVRAQFPGLQRQVAGRTAAFFDGPAGSQVPLSVADAVRDYLLHTNSNHGGRFATSRESDARLDASRAALADFLGADDPQCVVFGPNMTSLTFALSRALGTTWKSGDEVLVTRLDHDANVAPWVRAARDAGANVREVGFHREDATLDLEDFHAKLSPRTRLVALGYASNIVGTVNPLPELIRASHAAGAEVYIDAVHYAPHGLIDVAALDCDYLACSPYKFFGPHAGVLYGKRARLESLPAYKVRPAPENLPDRWMTGTPSHEAIVGAGAAVDYLAGLGGPAGTRRQTLQSAFEAIGTCERALLEPLLSGLQSLPGVTVYGITDPARFAERVPTVSFTHERLSPGAVADALAEQGLFVWVGNHYALSYSETMSLEPGGTIRVGLLHYNTADEVDRLLEALGKLFTR